MITASEISSNPPKIVKGLTKWSLVLLGTINTTKDMNSLLWCLYSNFLSVLCVLLLPLIKLTWTTMNLKKLCWLTLIQSTYWWQHVKSPVIHPKIQGINPMDIGYPWADSDLHNQKYEQSYVVFIYHFLLSVFRVLLITLIKLMQTTMKLSNFLLLTWIQSMYWERQVKSQKPSPSRRTSTKLGGEKIRLSSLGAAHRQFPNTT